MILGFIIKYATFSFAFYRERYLKFYGEGFFMHFLFKTSDFLCCDWNLKLCFCSFDWYYDNGIRQSYVFILILKHDWEIISFVDLIESVSFVQGEIATHLINVLPTFFFFLKTNNCGNRGRQKNRKLGVDCKCKDCKCNVLIFIYLYLSLQ